MGGFLGFLIVFALGVMGGAAGLMLFLLNQAGQSTLTPSLPYTGQRAVTLIIAEQFINKRANAQLQSAPLSLANISVTAADIDFQPNALVRVRPTFRTPLGDLGTTVTERLQLEGGVVAIYMEGDPQVEGLTIPIGLLPFNLDAQIRDGINRINRELIAAEINRQIQPTLNALNLRLAVVSTDDTTITAVLDSK